jgi:hypothetical protein
MSSAVRAIASRTLALTTAGILTLAATATANPATIDEIVALNLRAWGAEPELLSESYAPDGVHTATFYDRTTEYVGPEEIDRVAGSGGIELIGPLIEIPAADGELRWASFTSLGGGSACLLHAVDGRIVRHDCVLPETSSQARATVGLADAEASAAIDALVERLRAAWRADTSVERLAEVYAPDAVHSARYLDRTRVYEGPEGIRGAIRSNSPETLGGELAWAEVSDVAGGSVCLFRAVDGMITRHDCVLPIAG